MPFIHIQIEEQQDAKTRELAQKLNLNRSAYIRRALEEFNACVERELLAEQFKQASEQCRQESLRVCHEFEALEDEHGKD